jgi:peptide/nickel transport system ATP-binding protein
MALLEVEGLTVKFRTLRGDVHALTEASFALDRGDIMVLVGESGSGKTVLAHALMRLLPLNARTEGVVRLEGQELLSLPESEMRAFRGRRMSLIPQSPSSALNPVRRIGTLLIEASQARGLTTAEAKADLTVILAELGLEFESIRNLYPHQLSGGMQQRVVNALAMVGEPDLVIADEPTYGLDSELVEVTASHLLSIAARGAALLVITHDLRLAESLGGRLALIYASYIVELRSTSVFFAGPAHPYGQALLGAMPERGGIPIPGLPPELTALPSHCPFAPRCHRHFYRCEGSAPEMMALPGQSGTARCFLYAEGQ